MQQGESRGRFVALRLMPGEEVVSALAQIVEREGWGAASLVSAVGSLASARLRFAARVDGIDLDGPFEVVSLSGTIEPGGRHLHLAIADGEGRVTGGHLQGKARVFTTLEIVLLVLQDLSFSREPCAASGWRELIIR
ncbi:PPC domain-containing DNA-binding protein [Rhodobacter sp. NSM]|uniref:PPC domain-containing DNA-binding protein n=1 Tax=Rhodobacter sp. NSM TaxID=3457501 RepID=UPI003FD24F02